MAAATLQLGIISSQLLPATRNPLRLVPGITASASAEGTHSAAPGARAIQPSLRAAPRHWRGMARRVLAKATKAADPVASPALRNLSSCITTSPSSEDLLGK